MSIPLTINGVEYDFPEIGDTNWGSTVTNWAEAVTSGMLQKAGGSFTLTAEVDFGATYGAKIAYLKTQTANVATAGFGRLARADVLSWRNQANSANLDLGVSSSNILQFNGEDIIAGAIVNADISASAAIAFSKMAALTASRAVVSDGSGVLGVSAATSTEVGYLSGVSSAIQTQMDAKAPIASPTFTGTVTLAQDPASALQAATKQYVDSVAAGAQPKEAVRVATTADGTFASAFDDGSTVDGVVIATNDRILIKNQSDQTQNGIYVVQAAGAPSRSTDADTWNELIGARVFVSAGTANTATSWVCNIVAGGTLGVNNVTWVQNSANQAYTASGDGIELSGSQFALELDGTTLSKSGSGLKVNEIANSQIASAAAIAVNKLAALTASRAVVSDGSGFLAAATTTSTEIGYVNGVTSAIQTQLDAKTLKATLTTRGDMYYASAANTPARLAVGTSGYIIQSDGTDPVWTDQKISFTYFASTATSYSIGTSFTALTLVAVTASTGTPVTRASNTIQFPFTGYYVIRLNTSVTTTGSDRQLCLRLRNTTDGTTLSFSTKQAATGSGQHGVEYVLFGNVTDVSKIYEVQLAANGTGASIASSTAVDGVTPYLYQLIIERVRQ